MRHLHHKNQPQIEVTFDIDANGISNMSAKDKTTGKENKITIKQSSGLDKVEVEKMKREAELHADEDHKKKEFAEVRNEAENKQCQIEKMLRDAGDKLAENDKAVVQKALDRVKQVKDSGDVNALKSAVQELDQSAQALAQHLQGAGASPGGANKPGDEVIDAEYEVKK